MASIAMLMKINSVYCATLAGLDMFSPQSATAFFAPVASVLKLGDPDKSDEKTAYMRATCLAALMVYFWKAAQDNNTDFAKSSVIARTLVAALALAGGAAGKISWGTAVPVAIVESSFVAITCKVLADAGVKII